LRVLRRRRFELIVLMNHGKEALHVALELAGDDRRS
jgi:hypothetical protein